MFKLNQNISESGFSQEHLNYLRKLKKQQMLLLITRFAILILLLVLWEICARWGVVDAFITSQPSKIGATLIFLAQSGDLFTHVGVTLGETLLGFILGTVLGTLVAILLWWSDFLSQVLDPYIVVLNALPKIALGPIFIIWLGNGLPAILAVALAISLITTMMVVYTGFREVSENQVKLLKTFGATKLQILAKIIIPASVPTLISAAKINAGLTLVGVIVGEFLVSKAGLGYLIIYGGQVFNLSLVMTSILILSLVAALLYQGIAYLEKTYLQKRGL